MTTLYTVQLHDKSGLVDEEVVHSTWSDLTIEQVIRRAIRLNLRDAVDGTRIEIASRTVEDRA